MDVQNGVKTLPKYHPWNTLSSFDDILKALEADIICFQELKTSRKLLTRDTASPASFDAFISLPTSKTGYSGVGTYTRRSSVVPLKAEEGLTGLIQPKPPLSEEERVSRADAYPAHSDVYPPSPSPHSMGDEYGEQESAEDEEEITLADLDSEGRTLILDFGLFVLINTYCPNDPGTPHRLSYKHAYHRLLSARVHALIHREHRQVIVVGDLNACAAVIDHCEGDLMVKRGLAEGREGEEGFWGKGYRRWLRDWVGEGGEMVDVVRKFWPGRKGMYTCWNTKLNARETNYGTRIDFILCTPSLLPWIKAADTLPQIKGSDHCPVYVDFHSSITTNDGQSINLSDVLLGVTANDGRGGGGGMGTVGGGEERGEQGGERLPPRICARFWNEFSGKQTSLAQFFGKGKVTPSSSSSASNLATPSSSSSTPTSTPKPTPTYPTPIAGTPTPASRPTLSTPVNPPPPSHHLKPTHHPPPLPFSPSLQIPLGTKRRHPTTTTTTRTATTRRGPAAPLHQTLRSPIPDSRWAQADERRRREAPRKLQAPSPSTPSIPASNDSDVRPTRGRAKMTGMRPPTSNLRLKTDGRWTACGERRYQRTPSRPPLLPWVLPSNCAWNLRASPFRIWVPRAKADLRTSSRTAGQPDATSAIQGVPDATASPTQVQVPVTTGVTTGRA
ncbi:hypothetical protein NMY22_g13694 [Coprinellus aureogranulatus]|nr:hypothetical protein NMY22_g13694 [Coprinellus aureogranulatus]